MARKPDAALHVALKHRQRVLDKAQQVLSAQLRNVAEHARLVATAQGRVLLVLAQMDAAQRPGPGVHLAVAVLGDLERLLAWCEEQVRLQQEQMAAARAEADNARGGVAAAHQAVRALELVLEARAAERARKMRQTEMREADETAARVHARGALSRP